MKSLTKFYLPLNFFLLLLLYGCSTFKKAEKPVESYEKVEIKPAPSAIHLEFEAKLSDIQYTLNENLTGLLYEDNSLDDNGGDNIMVKAWKDGNIVLTMKENVLIYKVPLKVWIKVGFKKSAFGYSISDYREINTALTLNFRTEINLLPDWSVQTHTTGTDYKWVSNPVVKVGGADIPVTYVADILLKRNLNSISRGIDESLKTVLDFKPYVGTAWNALNSPIVLDEAPKLWLQMMPLRFYASNLKAVDRRVHFSAGLQSYITLGMGPLPDKKAPLPLPVLNIETPAAAGSTIMARVELPFDELNALAAAYIKGQQFSYGKSSVKVDNVNLYGSEGLLVAEVTLSGSYKGLVYFKGTPFFRESDSSLILKDFDFDLKTKNLLIKSAKWLYQDGFRKMIASKMVWSLAADLKNFSTSINKSLSYQLLAPGLGLRASMSSLNYEQALISNNGIEVYLTAKGSITIQYQRENVKK